MTSTLEWIVQEVANAARASARIMRDQCLYLDEIVYRKPTGVGTIVCMFMDAAVPGFASISQGYQFYICLQDEDATITDKVVSGLSFVATVVGDYVALQTLGASGVTKEALEQAVRATGCKLVVQCGSKGYTRAERTSLLQNENREWQNQNQILRYQNHEFRDQNQELRQETQELRDQKQELRDVNLAAMERIRLLERENELFNQARNRGHLTEKGKTINSPGSEE